MEFFKQKGSLTKDVCDTLLYVIAVQSLKPATLRDILTASQWNGMWFFSLAFFAVIFMEMLSDFSGYRSLHCMESIKWKCQRSRISQSSADCPMRKSESFH